MSYLFNRYNTDSHVQIDIIELNVPVTRNLQHTTRCGRRFDLTKRDRLSPYINGLLQEDFGNKKVVGNWFAVKSLRSANDLMGRLAWLFRKPASEAVCSEILRTEKVNSKHIQLVKTWTIQSVPKKGNTLKHQSVFVEVPMLNITM